MAKTGGTLASRIGGRPTAAARTGCGVCRHPKALHSNGKSGCRAYACTAGQDGQPCPGFVPAEETKAA
jgi:hypothetical protein